MVIEPGCISGKAGTGLCTRFPKYFQNGKKWRCTQEMKRRLLSILLLAVLLLSLLPMGALAEEPPADPPEEPVVTEAPQEPDPTEEPAPQETEEPAPQETEAPAAQAAPAAAAPAAATQTPAAGEETENAWGVRADDVIWLGFYDESPIAWLALDARQTNTGSEGMFLLSRDLIDKHKVVYDLKSTLWEGSLAQQWCTDFAAAAFSEAESALVPATSKHEDQVYLYALAWRAVDLKDEQVFFLSVIELEQYFGSYSADTKTTKKRSSMDDYWWLRSPIVYHDDYHGMVMQSNTVHDYMPNHHWSARPSMNLLLQDALFLLPAGDTGELGAVQIPEREGAMEWKLIAPLQEHSFHLDAVQRSGRLVTVSYSGAEAGEDARISLLARDAEGKPLGLWRLEKPTDAKGELQLNPEELGLPEGAALFLFCEQLGGEHRTNTASPLQALIIPTEAEAVSAAAAAEEQEPGKNEPTAAPAADEPSQGTIQPAEPKEEGIMDSPTVSRLKEDAPRIIGFAVFVLLTIGALSLSLRRRSVLPMVLLILLLFLAALVTMRITGGNLPVFY